MIFDFEQPSLYLGKVGRDDGATKNAFMLVKDLAGTEIKEVTTSSEFITARMLDYSDTSGKYGRLKMEVKTLPGLPLGRISETVTVKTNLADKPTAVLRLTGSVIGDVEVTPEWMTFVITDVSLSRPATLVKKIFITSHIEDASLEITDIRDDQGHLDLSLEPLAEGKKYQLTARLKPEGIPDRGNVSGNVVLTTNFPSQKEVAIRYSAVRKSYHGKKGTTAGKQKTGSTAGLGNPPAALKQGDGQGLFAPTKNDPFAPGGALSKDGVAAKKADPAAVKKPDASEKDAAKEPEDTENTGETEKKEQSGKE